VLTVGAVGLGEVGQKHARTFFNSAFCKLHWLYDVNRQRAEALSGELPGTQVADSYERLLEDKDLDVISIASYDHAHFEQVMLALRHRKHVFVEKPLCRSVDELRAMKSAWQAAGKPALESNLMSRGSPLYNWLATFVERGGLGKLYAVDAEYWYGRLHKITHGWRRLVPDYSVMQGGAVHLLDVVFMLTDERPTSCVAYGNRICTEGTEFKYHDYRTALYVFPSSLLLRLTANFGCVHGHQHVLRVFGTGATFLLDDAGARVNATRDNVTSGLPKGLNPAVPIDLPYRPASKGTLIEPFVELIRSGTDTAPLAQRNFDVISAILAADEAARNGVQVSVTYV
jgi:predicted dehydrogenase